MTLVLTRMMTVGVLAVGLLNVVGRTQVTDGMPQLQTSDATQNSRRPGIGDRGDKGDTFPAAQEKQLKLRNDDRQKRLVSDTEKLLALATQLHADVAKTDKNVLSLDVVRRAEEIERLARGVKERMKG